MSSETGPAGAPTNGAARRALSRPDRVLRAVGAATVSILVLSGCGGGGEQPSLERFDGIHTLTGAWVAPDRESGVDEIEAHDEFAELSGAALPITQFFYSWTRDPVVEGNEDVVLAEGGLPLVSWNDLDNRRIADGTDDDRIRAAARRFADLDGPVLLRWGWEMDADSSDGGTGTSGGSNAYVAAWKHLHDLFQDEGADNVEWVWCPNAYAFTGEADRAPAAFYPGDDVVDWLCADGYNFYPSRGEWESFDATFRDFYAWAEKKDKPILIGETGAMEDPADPQRRAEWIAGMGRTIKCRMPQVRALVYFEELKSTDDRPTYDWRLSTSEPAMGAWRNLLADRHFGGPDRTIDCS